MKPQPPVVLDSLIHYYIITYLHTHTGPEAMTNIWMEFEGMWEVVRAFEGEQPYMVPVDVSK
jgi:hypothetical protein